MHTLSIRASRQRLLSSAYLLSYTTGDYCKKTRCRTSLHEQKSPVRSVLSTVGQFSVLNPKLTPSTFGDLLSSPSQRSTIFALATPPGRGGIGIIRISGPRASTVWDKMLLLPRSLRPITLGLSDSPRTLYRCRIAHPDTREVIDDGMAVYFHAPHSYTSEDVLELHIHSGRAVITSLLAALSKVPGLRHAEAGEFTRRAFESGRIDLTEAEGIRDLIDAETDAQRRLALVAAEGTSKMRYEALRKGIIRVLASVEALIDFGEGEEIEDGVFTRAQADARNLRQEITGHLQDKRRGEILRSGIRVAIFGPPNAGKSSLLNFLAQRQAAIVTPLPGTTRDVLEVSLDIAGIPVILCDTAGLRDTTDTVEKIGVERANEVIKTADVKLCILSLPELSPKSETRVPDNIKKYISSDTLILLNKVDLVRDIAAANSALRTYMVNQFDVLPRNIWTGSIIQCDNDDAPMGSFMDGFSSVLQSKIHSTGENARDPPLITRARHREHLERAAEHLDVFLLADSPSTILTDAEELRYAAHEIGRVTVSGRIDVEDVLDSIFREFCIGK